MLSVENLSYGYGKTPVLRDVSLKINQGEIICLLGESGSGKTTLLRLIAGLESGYQGHIRLSGKTIDNLPVHQRGFGLMFQDFALFPHLNVAENIAFGLKMQGIPRKEQSQIIAESLALVGLTGYEKRAINELSGGQKQRVALARSLAPKPRLLMLDEPLGSLDAGFRELLVQDLKRIIKQIGLTAIYVTHDQQEAYAIADRIAIMNQGDIEQLDTPEQLYHQPKTAFVARFLGFSNIIPAKILQRYLPKIQGQGDYLIHPDGLMPDVNGEIKGIVREKIFQGGYTRIKLEIAEGVLLGLELASAEAVPEINQTIHLSLDTTKLIPMSNQK